MLKRVCICVRLCLSIVRSCVMFVYMPMCVRAFALREQLHSKAFLALAVEVAQQKWWDRIGKMSCHIMAVMGGGEGLT